MVSARYYPQIQIPENQWFTQILLYWDGVTSVMPTSVRYDKTRMTPYMEKLNEIGLVQFVSPERIILQAEWDVQNSFTQEFLTHLLPHRKLPPWAKFQEIHIEKLPHQLFHELERRGLARESKESHGWWMVEDHTANLYLAYFAGWVSRMMGNHVPVTDSPERFRIHQGFSHRRSVSKKEEIRFQIMRNALPVPRQNVDPEDLLNFKKENKDSLKRCKTYVDDKIQSVSISDDQKYIENEIRTISEDMQSEVEYLLNQMKKKWQRPALMDVGTFSGTTITSAMTVASTNWQDSPMLFALAVGSGLLQTGDLIKSMRVREFDHHSPLLYAASVAKLAQ